MSTLTVEQWTDYLNRKTQGFNCPICGRNRWQTQQNAEGEVMDVKVSDQSNTLPNTFVEEGWKPGEPSLLRSLNVIRCGHCGWVGLFDRAFVEEHFDDAE